MYKVRPLRKYNKSVRVKRQKINPIEKVGETIIELLLVLQQVDLNSPEAKLNKDSISDNNGHRIYL